MTSRHLPGVPLALSCGLVCFPGFAAEQAPESAPLAFEAAPFIGLRGGGDFSVGEDGRSIGLDDSGSFALALNMRIDEVSQYELFYSHQSTDFDLADLADNPTVRTQYLHLGGTVFGQGGHGVVPYGLGGLGITHFSADAPAARDDTRFSISLGGGLRVPFNNRFSLRFEARGYLTFVDTNTSFFCSSDASGGVCLIRSTGSTFFQYELLAGAAFAF